MRSNVVVMDTKQFLGERRRRTAGGILNYVENASWYRHLTDAQRQDLRDKVLSDIAAYHDIVLDVVKALEGDSSGEVNEAAMELLRQVNSGVQKLVSQRPLAAHGSG